MIDPLSPALLQCLWSPTGTLFSAQLTNFRIPPYCLTVRLALLNLATWAMVSAAKHFSSSLKPRRSFTIVCRPMEQEHKTMTLVIKYHSLFPWTHWKFTEAAAFVSCYMKGLVMATTWRLHPKNLLLLQRFIKHTNVLPNLTLINEICTARSFSHLPSQQWPSWWENFLRFLSKSSKTQSVRKEKRCYSLFSPCSQ